jgi:hypothetical protein
MGSKYKNDGCREGGGGDDGFRSSDLELKVTSFVYIRQVKWKFLVLPACQLAAILHWMWMKAWSTLGLVHSPSRV